MLWLLSAVKRQSIQTSSPYLAGRRSRRQTTWSCTASWRTQIPWEAEADWASWAGTPGCQRGARCPRCTPTATGRRVPGRQTCPLCARPCAAEHPQNNPCSVWWSLRRSLAQAWWSGQRVPHQLAARGVGWERNIFEYQPSENHFCLKVVNLKPCHLLRCIKLLNKKKSDQDLETPELWACNQKRHSWTSKLWSN